jgi:hypothetical protein
MVFLHLGVEGDIVQVVLERHPFKTLERGVFQIIETYPSGRSLQRSCFVGGGGLCQFFAATAWEGKNVKGNTSSTLSVP